MNSHSRICLSSEELNKFTEPFSTKTVKLNAASEIPATLLRALVSASNSDLKFCRFGLILVSGFVLKKEIPSLFSSLKCIITKGAVFRNSTKTTEKSPERKEAQLLRTN